MKKIKNMIVYTIAPGKVPVHTMFTIRLASQSASPKQDGVVHGNLA